jgi:hypothetical protein
MYRRITPLAAFLFTVAGCTPNDGDVSAIDTDAIAPLDQSVQAGAVHPTQDPARQRRCDELTGEEMRACLERAQYMPENAVGLADEASTRRQDPEQIDPALRERARFDDEMRNERNPDNTGPRVGVEGQVDETTGDGSVGETGNGNTGNERGERP